jgi:hypothetical protein
MKNRILNSFVSVLFLSLTLPLLLVAASGCGGGGGSKGVTDVALVHTEKKKIAASSPVDKAFAAGPLEVGQFADGREGEKDVIGVFEENGFKVRTKGDVRAFWAGALRQGMESAGAKFGAPANARFDAQLLEFNCIEGNTYNATVRMKITVTRHDGTTAPWSKNYDGTSKRWGKSHKDENFTEALSSAVNEVTRKMVQDAEFATAIMGKPAATP